MLKVVTPDNPHSTLHPLDPDPDDAQRRHHPPHPRPDRLHHRGPDLCGQAAPQQTGTVAARQPVEIRTIVVFLVTSTDDGANHL